MAKQGALALAAFVVLASCAGGSLPTQPSAAAVASADARATQVGIEILEAGGNAFDAAVAVTAVLAVAEPFNSGLGGGGFFLLHRAANGKDVVLDARESAPAAAKSDMYLDVSGQVVPAKSIEGALAAAIPGTPAALDHLARNYGRLPLSATLAPAIALSRDGFLASRTYHALAKSRLQALRQSPAARETFLTNGDAPARGSVIRQPLLSETLERIAREGAKGFYSGALARQLVEGVRDAGGIWSGEDLANYKVIERAPLVGEYQGVRVVSLPPPSSGGTVLIETLNVLEGFDLRNMSGVERKHVVVEALRLGFRDRAEYLGDPAFVEMPIARLTSKRYAESLRSRINERSSTASTALRPVGSLPKAAGENTTHFSILDHEGNRVAATISLNTPFGSAFMPPGTGILLNNTMDDFVAAPGQPNAYGLVGGAANAIEPGKRPLSSMTPVFLETEDRVAIIGSKGGSRIISQVLLSALDFVAGKEPSSWVSTPRYHHQYLPDVLHAEHRALSEIERAALAKKGHEIKVDDEAWGNMHAILWDKAGGRVSAASDPRGEGAAAVVPISKPDK